MSSFPEPVPPWFMESGLGFMGSRVYGLQGLEFGLQGSGLMGLRV